ncbi:MAG: flagellar basal body-associated FliL family protein [Elstera sp.]
MSAEMYEDDGAGGDRHMMGRRRLSGKKLILYILLPLLIIALAVGGLYFSGILGKVLSSVGMGGAPVASAPATGKDARSTDVVYFALPDLLVNLRSDTPRPAFLKLKISLELSSASERQEVEKKLPRVLDTFQTYLRELRPDQLQGAQAMFRLREELQARVNAVIRPITVKEVLFTEIVVQ